MPNPFDLLPPSVLDIEDDRWSPYDYEGSMSRWCHGCGNNAILTAVQKVCVEEQLAPERTVFVSGIGCASRFPHYMGTYGFHGVHGRALPVAEGIKIRRPDLHVFVSTGDGDCCSIGAGHWLHAIRYNMDMVVILHDNRVYGLTKKQASPTSRQGLVTNTSPTGALLEPLNPLAVTLGMANVSFVAQAVDWLPAILYDVVHAAFRHRGLSFVSILQRCPNFLPVEFDNYIKDPDQIRLLTHADALTPDDALARRFKNIETHDPSDLARARVIAADVEKVPVGILYQNRDVPCYEDLPAADPHLAVDAKMAALEREFDRFTVKLP